MKPKSSDAAAADLIRKAIISLILTPQTRFFGYLIKKLIVKADPTCNTAWTDGVSLGYNPAYVMSLSQAQLIGLLCHEVLHVANLHPWRRGQRDHETFNRAADLAINPIVINAHLVLPDGALLDKTFAGQSAEEIYQVIYQPPTPQPEEQPEQPETQKGESEGDGDGESEDEGDGQGDGDGEENGSGQSSGADIEGQQTAGQGGDAGQGQEREVDGGIGEVRDAPADQPASEAKMKQAILEAAHQAERHGSLPAGLDRIIREIKEPALSWKDVLRQFVQMHANSDFSWSRPNVRYTAAGLYLPSMRSESMPPIVVAVDTSGSIGEAMLAAFGAEITAIVEDCKPEETHVIYADAKVHRVDTFARGEAVELNPVGGGGTDFRPVFDHIQAEQTAPCCLIYLTDLYGTFPTVAPDYPVLWVSTTRFPPACFTPKFGEIVYFPPIA